MRSLRRAFLLFTCLGERQLDQETSEIPWGWLPLLGLLLGTWLAALYFPLTSLLFPSDVALLLVLGWQMFIIKFLPENALFLLSAHLGSPAPAKPAATLILALLLKFTLLRQFFPSEIPVLLLAGGFFSLAAPLMLAARLPKEVLAVPPPRSLLVLFTWLIALALAALAVGLRPWNIPAAEWFTKSQAMAPILGFLLLSQIFTAILLRESGKKLSPAILFSASLPGEIAVYAGVVSSRFLFL